MEFFPKILMSPPMSAGSPSSDLPIDGIFMCEWHREAAILRHDFPGCSEAAVWQALKQSAQLAPPVTSSESAARIVECARNYLTRDRLEPRLKTLLPVRQS